MNQKAIPSKKMREGETGDSDDVQERLVTSTYVHHDHGGREHGHDWDDWLKADRALKSKGSKKKRVYSKPEES
jgi:hypothetical protein